MEKINYNKIFKSTLYKNNTDELKKFCIDNKGKIDISIDISMEDELAFRYSCEKGNLELAKWLLEMKPNIDISALSDYSFRLACCNGHLHIAKWLLQIKPMITIENLIFYSTCENGYLEIAKWLFQINPKINISIYE